MSQLKGMVSTRIACQYTGLGRKKLMLYVQLGLCKAAQVSQGNILPRYMFRYEWLDELMERLGTMNQSMSAKNIR